MNGGVFAVDELPLSGIRAVEFTHAVMGPVAGHLLADLGADVIRVEPAPAGDPTRRLKGFGMGYHTLFNRNKKSLTVDIKTEAGREIAYRLLHASDVMIENFGPGTMERLGFGYTELSGRFPRLIYCSLKGFMSGPYEHRVALDEVVQMMTGLAYMTGPPGQPLRAGASIVDILGGTFGALGVLLSLQEREKSGRGGLVQNGLFETAAFLMGQHMAVSAISQKPVPPMPARISPWAIYRPFKTGDDQLIFIGITSDKHWQQFCPAFGREDLLADPELATNSQRVEAGDRLQRVLETMFQGMDLAEIIDRCEKAEIPFAPIAQPEDLFEDSQLNQGNSLARVKTPDGRWTKLPRLPLAINGKRFDLYSQPPLNGEHTRQVLQDLGYSDEEIKALHEAGVVFAT